MEWIRHGDNNSSYHVLRAVYVLGTSIRIDYLIFTTILWDIIITNFYPSLWKRDLRSNITQLMSGRNGIEISGEAPKEILCLLPTDYGCDWELTQIQHLPRCNSSCGNFRLGLKRPTVGLETTCEGATNIVWIETWGYGDSGRPHRGELYIRSPAKLLGVCCPGWVMVQIAT